MTGQISVAEAACGKRILLVDDDHGVRESVKQLLSIDRHCVTEAASGREALDLFAAASFDLVITDYLMPEITGDELAARIRRILPTQPIVMITAYRECMLESGKSFDVVLGKPFGVEALRRAIEMPVGGTKEPGTANGAMAVAFSRHGIMNRACARTEVLEAILSQGKRTRFLAGR
jgi:CheY-like chemotaxis protein